MFVYGMFVAMYSHKYSINTRSNRTVAISIRHYPFGIDGHSVPRPYYGFLF